MLFKPGQMKRLLLYSLLVLCILSCSSDDQPGPTDDSPKNSGNDDPIGQNDDNPPGNNRTVSFNLDGITLNYNDLNVVSTDSETDLEENVSVDIPGEQQELGLPIVFTKNDELLFGYYPVEGDSEITNDDILFFFFASFPSFGLLNIERDFVREQLFGSPKKPQIMAEMVASLNQEIYPFENEAFTELFLQIANGIIEGNESSKSSKQVVNEFKIDHERTGEIRWPNDVPLFATVGVEIFELGTNQIVSQDFLSPIELGVVGKIVDFVYNLPNDINNVNESAPSKQLQVDGEYLVRFSNGNPFYYNDTDATNANWRLLFTHALSVAFTAEILKWGNSNDECKASLFNLVDGILYENFTRRFTGIDLNDDAAIKILYEEFLNNSLEEIKGAIGVCSGASILNLSIQAILKKLDLILDTSNLILATRDFLISDIYEEQRLYFQDDFLVGEIVEEVISPTDFSSNTGEAFSFEANYHETVFSYQFNRDGIASTVISTIEDRPAAFLPFRYEIVEGDVTSDNPTSYTGNSNGSFILDFVMGSENSIIEITPEFLSPNVQTKIILANVCGYDEIQSILQTLNGVNWCLHTDYNTVECSSGPWFISGNNRITSPGHLMTSHEYYFEFYVDNECNQILAKGTSGFNGFTITYKVLIANEGAFTLETLEYPGYDERIGDIWSFRPQ